jgi:parallel beta-helix repeat protein
LHIAEGTFNCNNATIQHNDIGPCGSDAFQQWADGISVSCRNSHVFNNTVNNPTDGGIVLFGSPGTVVENNLIWVENVRSIYTAHVLELNLRLANTPGRDQHG